MLEKLKAAREDESGFSLIELLIVIVVLGILAGIVMFGVANFRSDATKSACQAEVKTVKVASTAYMAKTGAAAANIAALVTAGYLEATPTYNANITLNADGSVSNTCPA